MSIKQHMNHMTVREKIGQLLMVATAVSFEPQEDALQQSLATCPYRMDHEYIEHLIKNYHIGGIIFLYKGTPEQQVALTNRFQAASDIPLLIGQDLEWGLSMRLYNTITYPKHMTLGAIQDVDAIHKLGKEIARQCKELGVHINFAPVADVNSNPCNPVIHMRSFGENPEKVGSHACAFMQGLQDAGILACAKHFPGHGDTENDTHDKQATINKTLKELEHVELKPFKKLIEHNVACVMTGHLHIPCLDTMYPATHSHTIITSLLKNTLNFKGLVCTDGMGMKAITAHQQPGEAECKALMAGCDIILCPVHIEKAIERIEQAIISGQWSMQELDQRVIKILETKARLGLNNKPQPLDATKAIKTLHTPTALKLQKELYEQAVTVVKNNQNILPLNTHKHSTALVSIGKSFTVFNQEIHTRVPTQFSISATSTKIERETFINSLKPYEFLVMTIGCMNNLHKERYGITHETLKLIEELQYNGKKVILVLFNSPYSLTLFDNPDAIVMAYESEPAAQKAAGRIVMGTLKPQGILPVTASSTFAEGLGVIW